MSMRWPVACPVLVLLIASPTAMLLTSCGGPARTGPLRPEPVEVAEVAEVGRTPRDRSAPDPSAEPTLPATADGPTTTVPAGSAVASQVAAVAGALDRYDRALTDLSADPAAIVDAGHAARVLLGSTIAPGSALLSDLLSDTTARLAGGAVVMPGPGGLSWVHRPVDVEEPAPGRLAFTWCGWSPGVVVDVASGAAVDDAVGISSGTGSAVELGGTWVLASLDQTELRTEAPGTPDPCPPTPGAPR